MLKSSVESREGGRGKPPTALWWEFCVQQLRVRAKICSLRCSAAPCDGSMRRRWVPQLTKASLTPANVSAGKDQSRCSAPAPNLSSSRQLLHLAVLLLSKGTSSRSVQSWNVVSARRPLQLALLSLLVAVAMGQSCSSSSTCPDHANDKELSCFFKGINNMWGYTQTKNMNFPVPRP